MIKRYGQTMRLLTNSAVILAVMFIISGILEVVFKHLGFGIANIVVGILSLTFFLTFSQKRKALINNYTRLLGAENNPVSSNIMTSFPVPMVVTHIDGSIRWYNSRFAELTESDNLSDRMLEKILPEIKWSYILKNALNIDMNITFKEKKYRVVGNMITDNRSSASKEDKTSIYMYFLDKTTEEELRFLYENEKTDIAIVNIDNYEEVIQRIDDSVQQQIVSQIRKHINEWAVNGNAIIKNTDRDRYLVIFEHKHLDTFMNDKFKVLDNIGSIGEDIKVPVSISIGIGCGGSINENEAAARNALDLALGRGGDQVCIKNGNQYQFFGGKHKEYEKSTRVKTRAVAVALKDFIRQSDKVIIVGHAGADYDCFGAAVGLQRAVRTLGKTPYIIYDNNSPAIKDLYDELKENAEYKGLFVSVDNIIEEITDKTLLIVVDTHRPSMLPDKRLLEHIQNKVLIDHHRRSTEFIEACALVYHEPYASSACEMATELLEYMDLGGSLNSTEAECLYTGILMDTKNFMLKTGVRTFDAASYLRRLGLNTVAVRRMFNVNKADYDHKVDIVKTASEIAKGIAVASTTEKYPNIKVIASQAADEMLNIENVKASFVVYPMDDSVLISARSLGDINVQLIAEKLGGGGHMMVAGAQLKNTGIDEAITLIKSAVNEYFNEAE